MKTFEYKEGGLKITHLIDGKKHKIIIDIGALRNESKWYDVRRILMFDNYIADGEEVYHAQKLFPKKTS